MYKPRLFNIKLEIKIFLIDKYKNIVLFWPFSCIIYEKRHHLGRCFFGQKIPIVYDVVFRAVYNIIYHIVNDVVFHVVLFSPGYKKKIKAILESLEHEEELVNFFYFFLNLIKIKILIKLNSFLGIVLIQTNAFNQF